MKDCSKCGNYRPFSEFYKKTNSKTGYQAACKPCHKEGKRVWRANNPDKAKAWDDNRKYTSEQKEAKLKANRLKNKHYRDTLADVYIANLIASKYSFKAKDVPQELIELTRINLQLKRQLGLTSGSYKKKERLDEPKNNSSE